MESGEKILYEKTLRESEKVKRKWHRTILPGGAVSFTLGKYRVIMSVEQYKNGVWKHVSVTINKKKLPTWYDLVFVKKYMFGSDEFVIQIIPPDGQYVNVHEYCLHLWQYLDGPNWPIIEGGNND